MLRTVLVGLLATAAVGACGKSATPAAQPGAIAGNVVEVTGEVSVLHAGSSAAAPLAKGATVTADDEIVTGADGRVAILLTHNNARWDVKPGTHKKVSDSAAWGLAKVDQPAEVVDHATSAAGRDQEKAGADTSATANTSPTAPPTAQAPAESAPASPASADPGATPEPKQAATHLTDRRAPAPGGTGASATTGAPPAETAAFSADKDQVAADVPHVESTKVMPPAKIAQRGLLANDQDSEAHGDGGGGGGVGTTKGGGGDPGVFRAAIAPHIGALTACLEPKSTHMLTISVKSGAITFVLEGKSNAKTRGCIDKIVQALDLHVDGSTVLTLEAH